MTLFFTIATISYLPQAITLLDSVKLVHPEFEFKIGLVDYIESDKINSTHLLGRYPFVQLHELDAAEFEFITSNYRPDQLSNAAKILFADHFFKNENITQVIYADADIMFFSRLTQEEFTSDITIIPHFTSPPPIAFKTQELEVLNAGLYNAGYFKMRKSANTQNFINWLRERCVLECIDDRCRGIYFDQNWFNFVPLYFGNVYIEKDLGYNVAYWNLHERAISFHDGRFLVNENALVFFHFSGWSYFEPGKLSNFQNRYSLKSRPDLIPLFEIYKNRLKDNFFEEYRPIIPYYDLKREVAKKEKRRKLKREKSMLTLVGKFFKKWNPYHTGL